jgi:NAD(P)-dependent dehydrogenase (short-subunit alcohol dehydrogenase family)
VKGNRPCVLISKFVVNDLGRNRVASDNALRVVDEIRAGGGAAMADPADVADFEQVSAMAARVEKVLSPNTPAACESATTGASC